MPADRYPLTNLPASLQLLLFIDERGANYVQNREIRNKLSILAATQAFELEIIDVGKQPDLVEYYRVIATPALVKLSPLPRQILAGTNLLDQIDNWWERWQNQLEAEEKSFATNYSEYPTSDELPKSLASLSDSVGYVSKLIKASDEIFQLKQEKEELLDRLRLQDRAMAILAHDLRNPLTGAALALGTLEIIHNPQDYRANSLEPLVIERLIKRARTQLQLIDKLVTDILQPLKHSSQEFSLRLQKLDLKQLVPGVISQLETQFQAKSQLVTTDIPADIPFIYGDEDKLRQVIGNLLDNAIKYTPRGGSIHISALHRTTQAIQVSVSDTGLGVPAANQKQIFSDRYRLDRDVLESGYGIGLALCQRIIRAHYGQIWVESASAKGSVFNFTVLVYQ